MASKTDEIYSVAERIVSKDPYGVVTGIGRSCYFCEEPVGLDFRHQPDCEWKMLDELLRFDR